MCFACLLFVIQTLVLLYRMAQSFCCDSVDGPQKRVQVQYPSSLHLLMESWTRSLEMYPQWATCPTAVNGTVLWTSMELMVSPLTEHSECVPLL